MSKKKYWMNNSMKAYTLIEMVIVMIISVLIVSMAFVVFNKVNNLSVGLRRLYQKNYQVVLLDQLMSADVSQSDRIVRRSDGFVCEYPHETRSYFISDYIVRVQGSRKDTFAFLTDLEVEYAYINEKNETIREVFLKGMYEEEEIHLFYSKSYGAAVLVNDDE